MNKFCINKFAINELDKFLKYLGNNNYSKSTINGYYFGIKEFFII